MSGDVQPRKRKDKKRRKDEGEQIPIQTHPPSPTNSTPPDDVNIHVHKEGGTGGGICAKLVFFVLLSALVVVLGMIITQYRGLTDIETVDTESRFSQIFEGWIDSSPDHHDDHNIEETLEDHDLDDEDDDHNASDEEEEEEQEPSEEEEDEEDVNADLSDERNEDDEVDDDEDEDEDEDEEEQAVDESEENQLDEDEDDEVQASEEERDTYESEEKDEDEDEDEDEQDHDEDEQELENIESDERKDDDDDLDDEVSAERKSGEDDDDQDDGDADGDDDGAVDEDDKIVKKVSAAKKVETREADDNVNGDGEEQQSSGTSSMAVKLGVGVALLVVAHLVLVRKWRTAPDEKPKPTKEESTEPVPDLKRRNTIVAPPTFQEVEPDMEPEEEDYSEDEEEESEEEEEEIHGHKSAKTRYQELRSTYTRSLTPEGEIDYHKPPEVYDEEYEENVDDEEDEELSEEEEEDEEKQEDEYEEEDDYDDDEDEELLKRLEAKYGKLKEGAAERQADVENSDSEKSEDGAGYEFSNITNKDDYKIKADIDEAKKSIKNNSAYAIKLFDKILQNYPSSPRSIYGKALALDYLADQRKSNDILEQALELYVQLLNTQNVPNALFEVAAERCINRMRFVGQYRNAISVHKLLIQRFSNNPKYSNDLAVTYLTVNRVEEARSLLKQILAKWPNDGFALVHYGFILKTTDNKLEKATKYLRKGLETRAEGVVDGRFYFHLGDALARLGQNDEAMKVYEEGVQNKVFLSKYQRSLYNVPRLTGKPWWNLSELPYLDLFRLLKQNWKKIRDEGLAVLDEKGYFQDESENLKDTGDWKQFELFARGQRNANCRACPFTCSIIERIPEARNCKRGQTKFSVMHPGTHVWPHCGPTNCRLRVHLGLKVPPKTFIRVAEETRSWEEGEVFVFDDSFEHEVWHNGTEFRLVLIVDIWHHELTAAEKRSLSPI